MAPLPPDGATVGEPAAASASASEHHALPLISVFLGVGIILVLAALGWWAYAKSQAYKHYVELEAEAKRREQEAKAEDAARLEVRREQLKEQVQASFVKNSVSVTTQKRELAKREAADQARMQARVAREKLEATAVVRERKKVEQKALEAKNAAEDAAKAEAYRQECIAAAMSRAEMAEKMGKLQAKMAAQRLKEYRERQEAEEAANSLIGQRSEEVSQHCDIKPPLPEGIFEPVLGEERPQGVSRWGGSSGLSPSAQRTSPRRRMWLPSTGWKSDREGGESAKHWAQSWVRSDASPLSLSGRGGGSALSTPTKGRGSPNASCASGEGGGGARSTSPRSTSSPQSSGNVYGYAHRLLGGGRMEDEDEGPPPQSAIGNFFQNAFGGGGAPAASAKAAEQPTSASKKPAELQIGIRRAPSRPGLNTPARKAEERRQAVAEARAGAATEASDSWGGVRVESSEPWVRVDTSDPPPPATPPTTPAPPQGSAAAAGSPSIRKGNLFGNLPAEEAPQEAASPGTGPQGEDDEGGEEAEGDEDSPDQSPGKGKKKKKTKKKAGKSKSKSPPRSKSPQRGKKKGHPSQST